MTVYCCMPLNMPENKNDSINCSNYARILNMPDCSSNNIIIVTVIILEFFSA